jgi:hypothetical protein
LVKKRKQILKWLWCTIKGMILKLSAENKKPQVQKIQWYNFSIAEFALNLQNFTKNKASP